MSINFDNKAFECSQCLKKYSYKAGLIGHARKDHPQQVNAIVDIKKSKGPDEEVMSMIEKNETGWICKECGRSETYRFTIKEHIERIHLRRRPYACSLCEKSYLTRGMLNTHVKRRHSNFTTQTNESDFVVIDILIFDIFY